MNKKIFDLYPDKNNSPEYNKRYSEFINMLFEKFEIEFPRKTSLNKIFELIISGWNLAVISEIIPDSLKEIIQENDKMSSKEKTLLKKITAYKTNHFKEYDRIIIEYNITKDKNGNLLTVVSIPFGDYIEKLSEEFELFNEFNDFDDELVDEFDVVSNDFDEAYINRVAVILEPLEPFFEWLNNDSAPEDIISKKDVMPTTYLIDNDIIDYEKWLKKNYRRLFDYELDNWNYDPKEWPKKRTLKLFKEWFHISFSDLVYDLEESPIIKE